MQPVPEGYKPLGFAGFTDKGTYTASEVYAKNDIVHNNNTTWRCLVNGTTGIIPAEGANWTIFIASESDSSGITTTDTEGLVGPAGEKVSNQSLIDAIAEKVAKQLVTNASLTNALAGYITKEMMSSDQTDDPDKVPTSALAYAMQQSIDELNGKMNSNPWSKVESTNNLEELFSKPPGIYFYNCQNATDNPLKGNMTLSITVVINERWGMQYVLSSHRMRNRDNSNSMLTEWRVMI